MVRCGGKGAETGWEAETDRGRTGAERGQRAGAEHLDHVVSVATAEHAVTFS